MTETEKAERRAKRTWVSLVVGLLGLQIVLGAVAINLATTDRSVAIVPDYHNVALNWDKENASRTLAGRSGWNLQVDLSDTVDESGMRHVGVSVHDNDDQPVDELKLNAVAFHHARGDDTIEFSLQSIGDGRYQALVPASRAGVWQFSFSFSIGEQTARVIQIVEAG